MKDTKNPYAPPETESVALPKVSLYSPGQIAWATFLGAPLAGCVLLALNYKRFGNSVAAIGAVLAGLIATVAVLSLAFVLPDNFPNTILPAAYTFALYVSVKALQGNAYEQRLANGGVKASGWAATGVGLLCLLLIFAAVVAAVFAAPDEWFVE